MLTGRPSLTLGLLEEKDQITQALKVECRTIKAAATLKPKEYRRYLDLNSKIRSRRKKLQRELLSEVRTVWFGEVDYGEVLQQLKGHDTQAVRQPPGTR